MPSVMQPWRNSFMSTSQHFILLRDLNQGRRFTGLSSPSLPYPGVRSFGLEPAADLPPEPAISLETLSPADLRDAARDPDVLGVARSMPTRLISPTPSDAPGAPAAAATGPTWGVRAVGADRSSFDGSGVSVAILDTGIDRNHPAFAGMAITELDFSGDGDGDVNGHGTHCAGTVFGRDVDGQRIGVARGVSTALIGKVLGDQGGGGSEMLFNGMEWAIRNNAQVLSMSLGFDFPGLAANLISQGWPEALATSAALEGYRMNLRMFDRLLAMLEARAAFNGGTVVVAASGNESRRPQFELSASVPAAALGVLSVGALGEGPSGFTVASFSNTNPVLAAPGVNVVSAATGGGLTALNGTSMAAPHVAGVAALWWQAIRERGVPVNAGAVQARLRAMASLDGLAPDQDVLDRGDGMVQAP
ncbi:subtilisin DY domain protein [Cyanobium sp. NS01]|nr:subtilisin DY domain protein [Cyanobium sp. NS01]